MEMIWVSMNENYKKQIQEWLKGNPQHNTVDDICCPDFSCCCSKLLAPFEERELFVSAYESGDTETTNRMCIMFLGRGLQEFPQDTYIAGTGGL